MRDEERRRFNGKVISAAMRKGASVGSAESDPFVDGLFAEWKATGLPLDCAADWLDERLQNAFISMEQPPRWAESEPDWPYFDGKPMVFMAQTTVPSNALTQTLLGPGTTVYLFGARQSLDRGFRMVYRTICQFGEIRYED